MIVNNKNILESIRVNFKIKFFLETILNLNWENKKP